MSPLRRRFGPEDLLPELAGAGVRGTVLVQTVADLQESREFLALAATSHFIWGVVGWVDLTSPGTSDQLDQLLSSPGGQKLRAVRHQVHDEPDPNWLCRTDVRRGLRAVAERGLAFDLLVRAREIPAAVQAVSALPDLRFVVDHLAKPPIASGADQDWYRRFPELAPFPNVVAKISGLVTEAAWATWTAQDLAPYVAAALERFGPYRLMWGSDWPVCLLAARYAQVLAAARSVLASLSPAEHQAIFSTNSVRAYGLAPPGDG